MKFYFLFKIHVRSFPIILISDRLLHEKYPSSFLARLWGKQRFLVPFNVLDLVYSQTVSWVGVFYCPLLPLIEAVTLMATFYIQKVVWDVRVIDPLTQNGVSFGLSMFKSRS